MLPLHAFIKPCRYTAKAKSVKRTLLQKVNFFQSSNKRSHLPYAETRENLGISEKQTMKLDISANFLKKKLFLHFKTTLFFKISFTVLKEWDTFESNSVSFSPSCSLQPSNSCFTSLNAIVYVLARTFKPCSIPLETTGFSTVVYIKLL